MRAIMLHMDWLEVERVLKSDQHIIIRKRAPKCDLPIKVYIYNMKVVAEFILSNIDRFFPRINHAFIDAIDIVNKACSDIQELEDYSKGGEVSAWHISSIIVYDQPKELSEFSYFIPNNECKEREEGMSCEECKCYDKEHEDCMACFYASKPITRAPRTWCYIEDLGDNYDNR